MRGVMQALRQKLAFSAVFLTALLTASRGLTRLRTTSPDASQVERGRYLVEEVAKCGECHSPRDAQGQLDHKAWLQGAPIWIMPVRPVSNWADRAPALAGFPSFTEEQGERILEKGT